MRMRGSIALLLCALMISAQASNAPNLHMLFEQGMEAFKTGNYGSSELLFRKIIDSGNHDELRMKAWYYLALSIFNQKNYKAAIFEFNRLLLNCASEDFCLESRYWIAESHFHRKDYIRAIEEYKRFIAQNRSEHLTSSAFDRIGEIYFLQERYDEAVIEWREAINSCTNVLQNSQRIVRIGEALYLNKNYDEALQLLETLISPRTHRIVEAQARMLIGAIYRLRNRPRDALRIYYGIPENILKEAPFCDAQYFKALSSLAVGDAVSAKSYLDSFLLIGKNSEWYHDAKYELGALLVKRGMEREAIELLEEVRRSTKKVVLRSRAAFALSQIFLKKKPEEAIPYLEDAAALEDPLEQKNALLMLSRAYIDSGRFDDAERILTMLLDSYSNGGEREMIRFLIARVYLDRKDTQKAIDEFNRVMESDPGSAYAIESRYYLATAFSRLGQKQKAVELLKRYIAGPRIERRYEAGSLLVRLYADLGDMKNAESQMWLLARENSRRAGVEDLIYDFSIVAREKGLDDKKYLQYILTNYPRSNAAGRVLLGWGDEAFKKKDYALAEYYYRMYLAVDSRPQAGSVFLYRIISLHHLGRYRELISLAGEGKTPLMDDYTGKQLLLWIGRSQFQIGNYEAAYTTFMKNTLYDYSAADLLLIQSCALRLGDMKTAQSVPGFLERDPGSYVDSLYALGMHFMQSKDHETARGYFQEILRISPSGQRADEARLESAEILITGTDYSQALEILSEVTAEKHRDRRLALTIIIRFRRGETAEAVELTKQNSRGFQGKPVWEGVIRENLWHYYHARDPVNFSYYAGLLQKYPGNAPLINYLSGKLSFALGKPADAYPYFFRCSQFSGEYRDECLYHLGLISLFKQRNRALAMDYFRRCAAGDADGPFAVKARLNLAILTNENGDIAGSRVSLKEVLDSRENMIFKIQAENLWKYYGYSE